MASINTSYANRIQVTKDYFDENIQFLKDKLCSLEESRGAIASETATFQQSSNAPNYEAVKKNFSDFTEKELIKYKDLLKASGLAKDLLQKLGNAIAYCTKNPSQKEWTIESIKLLNRKPISAEAYQDLAGMGFSDHQVRKTERCLEFSVSDLQQKATQVSVIYNQLLERTKNVGKYLGNALYARNKVNGTISYLAPLLTGLYYLNGVLDEEAKAAAAAEKAKESKAETEPEEAVVVSTEPTPYQIPDVAASASMDEALATLFQEKWTTVVQAETSIEKGDTQELSGPTPAERQESSMSGTPPENTIPVETSAPVPVAKSSNEPLDLETPLQNQAVQKPVEESKQPTGSPRKDSPRPAAAVQTERSKPVKQSLQQFHKTATAGKK